LRDYIDRIFAESSKVAKKRERIQVPDDFYNKEMDAPVQAPKWTLGGYRGSLKAAIQEAIKSIPRRVEATTATTPTTPTTATGGVR